MNKLPTLIFATQNLNKIKEVQALLQNFYKVQSLAELGCDEDIPETADTFAGNAEIKSRYVFARWQSDCFADDSGLEVKALNGAPGVFSARYAGTPKNDPANVQKLLQEVKGIKNREARFVTVICLMVNGKTYFFEGEVKGTLTEEIRGENGFGYDPVFIPEGHHQTFAEMTPEQKNKFSHRSRALAKMSLFLQNIKRH